MPLESSGVTKGGMGVQTPYFSKSCSSRFAQKRNKLVGGGGGVRQICQEEVSEILEKQAKIAENCFSRIGSKVLVSKKYLNTAGRSTLS